MSDPAPSAPATPSPEGSAVAAPSPRAPAPRAPARSPAPPPRATSARWLDGVSLVLLCVGVGGAVLAAAPSLIRASGLELRLVEGPAAEAPPTVVQTPDGNHRVIITPHSVTASESNPRFAPPDDPPHLTELERMYPDGMWPGQGKHEAAPAGRARGNDAEGPPGPVTKARPGHARARLTLHEKPDAAGPPTGEVKSGESVIVVRESGDWTLVVTNGGEDVRMGWARRADVVVP